jgi:tRNA dimethylallyltransferase
MKNQRKPTVIAIVGPTASGKTSLSLEIAQEWNAEIIACDSRTVYKHFDIGTAKPSREEMNKVTHHLIDVADPNENYTVAQFAEQGRHAIDQIIARGKQPIVCGGTGFYSRALLEGLVIPAVEPHEELRLKWHAFADEFGNEALHQELRKVDPQSADKLNPNDRFRIIRALEVYQVLGKPMSEAATKTESSYDTVWIGLTFDDRSLLHANIRKRFQEQMDAGMMAETERLYQMYGANQKLLHTVNYKQLVELIEGRMDQTTAFEEAIKHNIQLARRQLIWFRANKNVHWHSVDRSSRDEFIKAIRNSIKGSI